MLRPGYTTLGREPKVLTSSKHEREAPAHVGGTVCYNLKENARALLNSVMRMRQDDTVEMSFGFHKKQDGTGKVKQSACALS